MKPIKLVTILISFVTALSVVAIVVPAEYFVLERKGSIEWGQRATRLKLNKYELIGRPEELRSWLLEMDGAPGQEAAVLFLSWGINNQNDFDLIVEGIDPKRKPAIINWLAGMIIDRGMGQSFRTSFSGHNSPAARDIFAEVDRLTNDGYR